MKPIDKTANDLFQTLRTRFSPLNIGDENAEVTVDPAQARFFSFMYKEGDEELGPVSISIVNNRNLKVYYSNDMVENMENNAEWYALLKELRYFAKQNLLSFDARNIQKDQLDTRDFNFLKVNDGPYQEKDVEITESAMYGSKRKSMQRFENATLIVNHKKSVDETVRGSRSRYIESIFIESNGERFRFPINYLNGARAMAVHVSEGGTPYDAIGQHIITTVTEMQNLAKFARMTKGHAMEDAEAAEIRDRVVETYHTIKKDIMRMQNVNNYKSFAETFTPTEASGEADVTTLQEKFTRKVWNEKMDELLPSVQRALSKPVAESGNKIEIGHPDDYMDPPWKVRATVNGKVVHDGNDFELDGKRFQSVDAFIRALAAKFGVPEDSFDLYAFDDDGENTKLNTRGFKPRAGVTEAPYKPGVTVLTRTITLEPEEIAAIKRDVVRAGIEMRVRGDQVTFRTAKIKTLAKILNKHVDFGATDVGSVLDIPAEIGPIYDDAQVNEASPSVEKSIKNPNFLLVLKKDDAADAMIKKTKFTRADGLLSFIMSDIASRIIGDDADAVANFASEMAINIGDEGASFGTKMTPDYKRDKQLAMMLAKKYLDDLKMMATDPAYASKVRKDPKDVYGAKKVRGGGYHEAVEAFESWAEEVTNSAVKTVTEGVWAVPDSVEKIKALRQAMRSPIPASQVSKILGGIVGDDSLFDRIGEIEDEDPNADVRRMIYDWIRKEFIHMNLVRPLTPDVKRALTKAFGIPSSEFPANEAAPVPPQAPGGVKPASTNPQVVKALSGGDPTKARDLKRVSDKLARGQKLSPQEMPLAGEIAKSVMTTKKPTAAMQALAQDEYTEMDEVWGEEDNPVKDAIIHRLSVQYGMADLLKKYGLDRVEAAIDDVAGFHDDVEELGSSDISIMVRQVLSNLEKFSESAVTEMNENELFDLIKKARAAFPNSTHPVHLAIHKLINGVADGRNVSQYVDQIQSMLNGSPQSESVVTEKNLQVKADADYDGDGEIESPEDEYRGVKDRAIKKTKHTQVGGDEELVKESLALLKKYAGL